MNRFFCLLLLPFLLLAYGATAQQNLPFEPQPPKALIVLLPYSAQRINVLREQGDFATAEALAHDYAEMRRHMIADFKDNYTYGTYYFLPDSLAYTLRDRADWNNLLLDANLQPVAQPGISPADTAVLLAQYGIRARATETSETMQGAEERYGDDFLAGIYPAFILTDANLQPFPRKMRRLRWVKYAPQPLRHPRWVYYYRSKRFQIGYNHAASGLAARIALTFGGPPPPPKNPNPRFFR